MNTTFHARTRAVIGSFVLAALSLLPACRPVPSSDYLAAYKAGLANVALPQASEILQDGVKQTFQSPVAEVWQACLRMATQKPGLLALDSGSGDSPRRLMLLDGQRLVLQQQTVMGDPDMSMFLDTWLAVAVVSEGPGATTVSAAWVSPDSGKVAPFPVPGPKDKRQTSIAGTGPAFWPSKVKTQRLFVPRIKAEEFLTNVAAQLYGPDQWLARFKGSAPPPRGTAPSVKTRKDPGYPELKNDYGNWCSLLLRRNTCLIESPELTAELTRILEDLKQAAGKGQMPTRVYVMASREVNAFSLPNGDIFICTGLLDLLSDTHEVAAVLGHELDHYVQHDAVHKIRNAYNTQVAVGTGMVVLSVAGGVAAAMIAPAAPMMGAVSVQTQIAQELFKQAITNTAVYTSMGMGDAIVSGYSREIELRADNNGLRYVWAAGYEPKAMMQVMTKLKGLEMAAREQKGNCGSALVNCEPGLEKRTAELQLVMEEVVKGP